MSTGTTSDELRSARYGDWLRYPEWRVFAHRCKVARGCVCQGCAPGKGRRREEELQVHHWWYDVARRPWEYALEDVAVLCASCHAEYHELLKAWETITRARWDRSELELRPFLRNFRRHVFPGLSLEAMRGMNVALGLGVREPGASGPLASQVVGVLMGAKGAI